MRLPFALISTELIEDASKTEDGAGVEDASEAEDGADAEGPA